ncbi:hypothetical protein RBB77_11585 [Tunturibacter psychrotolerans]|uniref:Helix-turn-helix domain-containing protein n=1 Tax=Tunturiibacter psychrotolerans TaxID=3069686 RepID=A0AAU7ZJB1_9BACT
MKRKPQKQSSPTKKSTPSLNQTPRATKSRPKNKGLPSKSRAKPRLAAPRTEAEYLAKPEKFKDTWDRVLGVVSKMRREKISLTQASRDAGINPRTVTRWGKTALQKQKNGKYAAKKSDSLLRLVIIPTPDGTRDIAVRGSKQVTLLAEYWNALHRYLQTGDSSPLKKFQGKHIVDAKGVDIPLSVDLSALNRLGSAGVLSFESLYARTT